MKPNTGAIVGGTIGGLVILGLIGYFVWCFPQGRRKSNAGSRVPESVDTGHVMAELEVDDASRMMFDGGNRHELRAMDPPKEASIDRESMLRRICIQNVRREQKVESSSYTALSPYR